MNVANRDIPNVNRLPLAQSQLTDDSWLDNGLSVKGGERKKAEKDSGVSNTPLAVEPNIVGLVKPVELPVVDIDVPIGKINASEMGSETLNKLIERLKEEYDDKKYHHGMKLTEYASQMAGAIYAAGSNLLDAMTKQAVRTEGTQAACEALEILARMAKAEDPASVDFSSASPEVKALVELFKGQIGGQSVLPAGLAEQVLRHAWDDIKSNYTDADLKQMTASIDEIFSTMERQIDGGTVDEVINLQKALEALSKAQSDVTDADGAVSKAEEDLANAGNEVETAENAVKEAQEKLDNAPADILPEDLEKLEQALSDAKLALNTAQAKERMAKSDLGDAQKAQSDAAAALKQAQGDVRLRQSDYNMAVGLIMDAYFAGMKAVVQALADYAEAVSERVAEQDKVNRIKARMKDDIEDAMRTIIYRQRDSEKNFEKLMAALENALSELQEAIMDKDMGPVAGKKEDHV